MHKYLFLVALLLFISCSKEEEEEIIVPLVEEATIPTNLVLNIDIVGADISHLYGDGTGVVKCTATATNAVKYGFKIGSDIEVENLDGSLEYTFTNKGINDYIVTVFAYSKTGHVTSIFKTIKVYFYVEDGTLQLTWFDEFSEDGATSSSNWTAETIAPNNGSWWNGEEQHYTDRLDNAFISEGTLKIVAKKESYTFQNSTKQYTSARLITKDKFEFKYGRVEVRAKLPEGEGTWPAIWMLGSNIDAVGWPACGEIDIMEHWGHNPTLVSSATHTTFCSGGCSDTSVGETAINDYASEFHVYTLEWTEDELRFLIDDVFLYSYKPSIKNSENWPFDKPQFFLLNVAMGGSWFNIDPNFTESIMEVDYIRVYQ